MSVVYGNIGQIFYKKSEYISALKYYDKALMINEELGDKDGKARTYIRKGNVYTAKVDYYKAEELFEKALSINKEIGNKYGISSTLGNLGLLYYSQADYPKALEYYLKSLKINREIENTLGAADNLGNIGMIHNILSNQKKALEYFNQALQDMKEIDDKEGTSRVLYNIGESYLIKKQYDKALEYFEKSYDISDKIGNKKTTALTLGSIGQVHFARGEFRTALDYYEKALAGSKEIGDEAGEINQLENIGELYIKSIKDKNKPYLVDNSQLLGLNNEVKLNRSIEYFSKSSSYYAKTNQLLRLSIAYKLLHEAYKLKGDYENALSIFTRYNELKDSIFSNEKVNQISELEKVREEDLKQKEIEKQKIRIAEQEKREQLILYFSIGLVLLLTVVMIIIYRLLKRSDKLLYNVLPISIAKRLKNKEHPISDYFTQASIVFIDIVNFTEMARDADPRKIVEDLNKIFTHYDTIANKYGLEKIKTIGDSYMAAAGIPEVQKDNTHRAAQMALEVKEVMNDYRTADGIRIEVRIGLDCGPVVAGVIGENKFIYDMWSDAVNTASRMESSSVAGQVHITERFKIAVSEYEDFEYEERGEIAVKGKGKMNTYFMGGKVNAG